jgi:hypothetical protein
VVVQVEAIALHLLFPVMPGLHRPDLPGVFALAHKLVPVMVALVETTPQMVVMRPLPVPVAVELGREVEPPQH